MAIIHRAGRVPRRLFLALVGAMGLLAFAAPAQETEPSDTPPAAAAPAPAPAKIPVARISSRAEEASAALRATQEQLAPPARVEQARKELEAFAGQLDNLKNDPALADPSRLNLRQLDDLEQRLKSANRIVRGWETILAERATVLDQQLQALEGARQPWALTLAAKDADDLPQPLVDRIEALLKQFDAVEAAGRERLDTVLTFQNRVSERLVTIGDAINRIDQAKTDFQEQMLIRIDGIPLWKLLGAEDGASGGKVQQALGQGWRESLETSRSYLRTYPERLVAVVLAFLGLAGTLLVVRARRRAHHAREGVEDDVIDVLSRPIAAALLLSIIVAIYLFDGAPLALRDLLRVTAALPVFLLMRHVVPSAMRLPVYSVIALFVLDVGGGIIARRPEVERWLELVIAGSALAVLVWTLRPGGWTSSYRGGPYWRLALFLLKAAALVLTVAIVANVVGATSLSTLLTAATLTSVYAGLAWYTILLIVQGLMDVILNSSLSRRSRGLARNAAAVRATFERLTNLLGAFAWLVVTLRAFRIGESVWEGLKTLLFSTVTIGNLAISLADIAAFVLALWAGFVISKILRFILEEDVYPRVSLPRGVPSTISAIAHYVILTIAFFIALAAAGIELGSFAIIAGAIGVGIGFGLQNVVNNFVSGLILLFERPIQAGDSVELGTLFGRVVRIGIRSSTVRTYQGAEVIVPNADLISKEVINWTLSDSHRRLEVPVGVSYEADPKEVIGILLAAAKANKEVMREPEPAVLFIGYGASSLDFELRAWIQSYLEGLRVKTDLYLDIWYRLEEAGIEIPFPQQDLHLRSVDGEAAALLAGRPVPGETDMPPSGPEAAPTAREDPQGRRTGAGRNDPEPSLDADGEV
jgi:potassium efflux system protein